MASEPPEIRRLWMAVLIYGLHDTAAGRDEGWICSADFELICTLAGLEPGHVLRSYAPERFKRLPHLTA